MKETFTDYGIEEYITALGNLIDVGDFRVALGTMETFLEIFGGEERVFERFHFLPKTARAQAIATLGELYFYLGRHKELQNLVEKYKNFNEYNDDNFFVDLPITLRAKLQMIEYLYWSKYPEKAEQIAKEVEEQCRNSGTNRDIGDCCFVLATLCARRHKYKDSERYYEDGLALFYTDAREQRDDLPPALRWRLGVIFLIGGYARWRVGELTRASNRLNRAEIYLEKTGDFIRMGALALGMGCVQRSKGEHRSALSNFKKAWECFQEGPHQPNMVRALMNYGTTHISLASSKKMRHISLAEKVLRKALGICEESGNIWLKTEVLIRVNWLYLAPEVNQPSKGVEYAQKALGLCRRVNSSLLFFETNIALGNAYIKLGKLADAKKHFLAAFEKTKEIDADKYKVEAHLALAEFYCRSLGYLSRAIEHYNFAQEILEQNPNDFLHRRAQKVAQEIDTAKIGIFIVEDNDATFTNEHVGLKELTHRLQIWTVRKAAEKTRNNKTAMARMLGLSRVGLDKLIKRLFDDGQSFQKTMPDESYRVSSVSFLSE